MDSAVLTELPASNSQEHMENILREKVETAIKNLKERKAPGEDNIVAEMIQAGEICSVEMLHMQCNKYTRKRNVQQTGRRPSLYQYTRKATKQNAVTIEKSAY